MTEGKGDLKKCNASKNAADIFVNKLDKNCDMKNSVTEEDIEIENELLIC